MAQTWNWQSELSDTLFYRNKQITMIGLLYVSLHYSRKSHCALLRPALELFCIVPSYPRSAYAVATQIYGNSLILDRAEKVFRSVYT